MSTRPSDRHLLRAAIGVLWLVAGALQLQAFMFRSGFAHDVLGTAALSQPRPLAALIDTVERVVAAHPAPWNWLFALAELVTGAGLVISRAGPVARIAGWGSVAFGLGVWVVGEGLGGLLTGTAALSTGAPGAAALYSLLTLAAWPRPLAGGGEEPLSHRRLGQLWLGVWLFGAVLVLVPQQWGARGLSAQAAMGWMMSPHWTAGPALAAATWLAALPATVAALLCIAMIAGHAAIGLGVLQSVAWQRGFLLTGAVLALTYWIFAQGFGGLSTGTATDVSSAPLIVVLAAAVAISARGPEPLATPARPRIVVGQR